MSNQARDAAKQIRARRAYEADLFGPQQQLLDMQVDENTPKLPVMLLRKHTNIVHSQSPMTCLQRQVYNVLLFNAQHELPDRNVIVHQIPLVDLSALVGFTSNNTEHLKKAIRGLVTCKMEFNIIEENGAETWEAMTALAGVSIRRGVCHYQFAEFLRDKLYEPERYAKLYLEDMRRLTMTSSSALYENTTRYSQWRLTPYFSLQQLRALLSADAPTYDDFRRFNNRVLGPAVSQVNEVTSFNLTPEYRYERRAVAAVRFKVQPKAETDVAITGPAADAPTDALADAAGTGGEGEALAQVPVDPTSELCRRLQSEMLLDQAQAVAAINQYGVERVTSVADYVALQYRKGGIRKIAPYFLGVLAKQAMEGQSSLDNAPAAQEDSGRQASRAADDVAEFKRYWAELLQQALDGLADGQHEELLQAFQDHVETDPIALAAYQKSGMDHQMVKALWRVFAAEHLLPDKKEAFEEWRAGRVG